MNFWDAVYRASWVTIGILMAVLAVCFFVPKVRLHRELQGKKAALQQDIAGAEERVRDLKDKQERFNSDPAFVEETARGMGMVKTNETLFKFTNEQSGAFGLAPP